MEMDFPRMSLRQAAHRLLITQEEAREAEDAALAKIGRELMLALETSTERFLAPLVDKSSGQGTAF